MNEKYSGADWVKSALKIKDMSPLGEEVADVLGQVWRGIYHLNSTTLRKIDWSNNTWIDVLIHKGLATFDGNELTELVVLVHDRMLRLEIDAAKNGILRLIFHQRKAREGSIFERCPTIEAHIEKIRKSIGFGVAGVEE